MPKFKHIFFLTLLALLCATTGLKASETLAFVKIDGSKTVFSVQGLKITYDDFAHAVVSNNETSAMIDLTTVRYMCFDDVETTIITGDVNGDGEVNVADINTLINIILSGDTDSDNYSRADVNIDGEVNIADVNSLIDIILG